MSDWLYNVDCAERSGDSSTRYGVYMAPSDRKIYTQIGDGQPAETWDNRHVLLGWVPACTVGDSLAEWLEEREPELDRIRAGFTAAPRPSWTRESLRAVDRFRDQIRRGLRAQEIGIYWAVSEWWATRQRSHLVAQALSHRSLDAFVHNETEAARGSNVWIEYDEALEHLREILRERHQRLESALSDLSLSTWDQVARQHYQCGVALDYVHAPEPPAPVDDPEARVLIQRRLSSAIRSIDPGIVTRARLTLRNLDPEHPLDPITLIAALAAAAQDDRIWDALSQVRQVVVQADEAPENG